MDQECVVRTIDLDAEPDAVWRALTEPAELAGWLMPVADFDAVEGGGGHFVDEEGVGRTAVVELVEPNEQLRFRWWADGDGPSGASLVTFAVSPSDGGTRLVVTEQLSAGRARASASTTATWAWRLDLLLLHTTALAFV